MSRHAIGGVTAGSGSIVAGILVSIHVVVGVAVLASVVHASLSGSAGIRGGTVKSGSSVAHLVSILTVHVILVVVVGVGVKSSIVTERAHALSIRAGLAG